MAPLGTTLPRLFNPYADIRQTHNRLPHWQQESATYFVTFRLIDSVPSRLLEQWESERKTWMRIHPQPWSVETELEYHKRFSATMDQWLDAGYGTCVLKRPACARIMSNVLLHFDRIRYSMISFVVMPNHVHTLFVQEPNWPLEKVLHNWKRFSSGQINIRTGRSGGNWQRDYFDRLVRDERHFHNCVRYIRRNPEKARLKTGQYVLYENELARSIV